MIKMINIISRINLGVMATMGTVLISMYVAMIITSEPANLFGMLGAIGCYIVCVNMMMMSLFNKLLFKMW